VGIALLHQVDMQELRMSMSETAALSAATPGSAASDGIISASKNNCPALADQDHGQRKSKGAVIRTVPSESQEAHRVERRWRRQGL
jgi:hypothetical protein